MWMELSLYDFMQIQRGRGLTGVAVHALRQL